MLSWESSASGLRQESMYTVCPWLIRLNHKACPCGSPLPVTEVQGRQDDALLMTVKRGQTVTLLPLALVSVLEEHAGVYDFQLRQKDG